MAPRGTDRERLNVHAERIDEHAGEASEFLKALADEGQLVIVCDLLQGDKSVGELEALLSRRQPSMRASRPVSKEVRQAVRSGNSPSSATVPLSNS
jgi:hypothetical protein